MQALHLIVQVFCTVFAFVFIALALYANEWQDGKHNQYAAVYALAAIWFMLAAK